MIALLEQTIGRNRQETKTMTAIYHRSGFREAVLDSSDDYEPYGYLETCVAPFNPGPHVPEDAAGYERVVEQMTLARYLD